MIEYISRKADALPEVTAEYKEGDWISVVAPDKAELAKIAKKFDLDKGTLTDVLDAEEIPRLEHVGEYDYIFVRFVVKTGEYSVSTKPMLIVLNECFLLTVAPEKPAAFEKLLAETTTAHAEDCSNLVLELLKHIFEDYSANIKQISHRIKRATEHLRQHKLERDDFVDFVLIEDDLSNILSALAPMSPILKRLEVSDETIHLDKKHAQKVDDIILNIEQSIQSCNSNMRRIVSVREAYSTISNNSLNRTMKTLTALTLLVALPNVVFGMYGMNVALPGQGYAQVYPLIIGGTAVFVIVVFVIARIKRVF